MGNVSDDYTAWGIVSTDDLSPNAGAKIVIFSIFNHKGVFDG